MKKLIFILQICIIVSFASCSAVYGPNLNEQAQKLELGMSKEDAVFIMGNNYVIESATYVDEGMLEILLFRSSYYSNYFLYFLNGSLTEFHRYIPPVHPNVSGTRNNETVIIEADKDFIIDKDIFGNTVVEDNKGNKKTVKKDIFGSTVIEDNKGNKKTIKKDIFGDTVIEDNKGNKKTVKKDIFGDTVIEDNKGNKKTIKKDIFGDTVIEDNKGNKKTVKKDIFGNTVIEDNKGNKTTIKKDIFGNYTIEER